MTETARHLLEELGLALAPVVIDVMQGKTAPEVLADAVKAGRGLVLQVASEHLLEAHGAVLLADLKALGRAPAAVLAWLKSLPPATEMGSGNPDATWDLP